MKTNKTTIKMEEYGYEAFDRVVIELNGIPDSIVQFASDEEGAWFVLYFTMLRLDLL